MAAGQHPNCRLDQPPIRRPLRESTADRGTSPAHRAQWPTEPQRSKPLARLTFALALALASVGLIAPATLGVLAFTPPASGADQVANLKDTLEKGLKARRPEEFQFIARVVKLVEEGQLPLPLVLGTFKWARSRSSHIPYPYFKRGLQERAARIGVRV